MLSIIAFFSLKGLFVTHCTCLTVRRLPLSSDGKVRVRSFPRPRDTTNLGQERTFNHELTRKACQRSIICRSPHPTYWILSIRNILWSFMNVMQCHRRYQIWKRFIDRHNGPPSPGLMLPVWSPGLGCPIQEVLLMESVTAGSNLDWGRLCL